MGYGWLCFYAYTQSIREISGWRWTARIDASLCFFFFLFFFLVIFCFEHPKATHNVLCHSTPKLGLFISRTQGYENYIEATISWKKSLFFKKKNIHQETKSVKKNTLNTHKKESLQMDQTTSFRFIFRSLPTPYKNKDFIC